MKKLTNARYERDLLRYRLAVRLLRLDTRTRVIQRWTGLSMRRVGGLRRYVMNAPNDVIPRRGVAPYQPALFFGSARIKTEAAVLTGLLYVFEVVPREPLAHPEQDLPGLVRGMRLCDAYGQFAASVPDTRLSVEHAMLLAVELVKGNELKLGRCTTCSALVLVDQLAVGAALCTTCSGDSAIPSPYSDAAEAAAAENLGA